MAVLYGYNNIILYYGGSKDTRKTVTYGLTCTVPRYR
jgi:hypothetical protein